ncbi:MULTISPECIES: hypothetical protein [unclassified Nitrobacter]|uniref:hypothetical protein n=1 Tax=unclassified Nitrobacter TaxID=2620411 RepID=UPI001AD217EE|nr:MULTISPECIES: hypothetical protein [unclassified Nitrobacter]MBN9149159.1 hypothetical protein [Nitrobacter sp.]
MPIKMTPTHTVPSMLSRMTKRAASMDFCLFRPKRKGQGGPVCASFDHGAKIIKFPPNAIEYFGRTMGESDDPFTAQEWDDDELVSQCRTPFGLGFRVLRTGQTLWLHRDDIRRWTMGGDFPKLREQPPRAPTPIHEDRGTLRNALRNVIRECSDADERKRIPPTPPDSILNATIWQRDDGYIMYSIEYEQAPVDDFG